MKSKSKQEVGFVKVKVPPGRRRLLGKFVVIFRGSGELLVAKIVKMTETRVTFECLTGTTVGQTTEGSYDMQEVNVYTTPEGAKAHLAFLQMQRELI